MLLHIRSNRSGLFHNDVAKVMHLQIGACCELLNEIELYYQYQQHAVMENNNYKLYWVKAVITD